jgi:glycerol uptake facilitator-like aquaporin
MPKPGQSWQAAGFEAIITFGLVLMILNLANGPKLNGPFVPLAVGRTSWPGARWAGRSRARR